ncbi:MAG: hypothetical protein K2F79_01030, partial [Muribaculaceae bacterium]|nr:hypothetical protein [Muribaculaceae bacterium]
MKEYIFRRVPLLNRFSLLAVCCALALLFGSAAPSPPRRGHLRTGNYEYEGGVTDGKQNGYGVCRYTNGNVYYGFWNMGYKEGLGRLVFADGTMDFGVWRRGRLPKQKSKKFKAGKRVYGIDAAKYQKTINWEKLSLKADASGMLPTNGRSGKFLQPVLFALVKSTEGTTVRDPQFERNFREAKRCGVVRGAYHFLNPNTPASAQAKFFIANTPHEPCDLPPILDLDISKKTMARDHAKIVRLAKEWLRIIE